MEKEIIEMWRRCCMENIFLEVFGVLLVIYSISKLSVFAFYKRIEATCIDVSCKWSYSDGEPSLGYSGTFMYTYDGREIISKDKSFLDSSKLEVGHSYVLLVNPKNPSSFVTKSVRRYYVFFLLSGLALSFFSPLLL